jgi:protein-arginine kinase activator protein McsA
MARVAITERAMNAAHVLRANQGQPRAHPGRGAGTDAPATAAPADIEALRQALPQLARLERYARRAFLRGERAARRLAAISCYEPERSTDEAEVELE